MITPSTFRVIFSLIKTDTADFDRSDVSRRLSLTPSSTKGPEMSKGQLFSVPDSCDGNVIFPGLSFLPANNPPYQIVKHAFWRIELPKIESRSVDMPLHCMEEILCGKEAVITQLYKDYELFSMLTLRVYANTDNIPVLSIPSRSMVFWGSIATSIDIDLLLD